MDATDLRILALLQQDASVTNQELAKRAHVSPATCLRRVRRLEEDGFIERRVAILSPAKLGAGLTAIVEITLDQQASERLIEFETRICADDSVQQCYRVTSGPDFILVLQLTDMDAYHATAHRLFSADVNVRNVRAYFSVHRAKFSPHIHLPTNGRATSES